MADDLKEPVAGETEGFLDAEYGAKVIRAVNALRNLVVSPQGLGSLKVGDKNVVLDLTPLKTLFDQISTTVAAMSTVSGAGGGGGGGSSLVLTNEKINEIIGALRAMTITAECDPDDGTITVTLNIDLPDEL